MKQLFILLITVFLYSSSFAQALYRSYPSDVLGTERNIKVLKPRNYKENPEKTYPLIIVLDGDYLFEPVAGNVDYLSYWDQMPESFVIGINQRENRWDETVIDEKSGFPERQTLKFMDFVIEIVETMQEEYRVAPFTVIIGKDVTANIATFYLMGKKNPFDAFINIDPEYSSLIKDNLASKISDLEEHNYYYIATAQKSNSTGNLFNKPLDSIVKPENNVHFKHDVIDGVNKYNISSQAIPRGFDYIFEEYKTIETDALISKDNIKAVEKLQEKYKFIKEIYGIDMSIRLIDLVNMANKLIENKEYDQLIDLAQVAKKEHPKKLYGRFIEGLGYEGLGRINRAIKSFNAAYSLEPSAGITKEDILDKVETLQAKK